ncbi:MAG TPA: YlxQ family RNA-binding protein [Bacillales bacterium]|nr:YlxQ family RNA-binding protein [Bacillales bacterium]
MKQERWFSLLGLAFRAGKVVSGEEAVLAAVRNKKARLVLVAGDASARSLKQWRNKCEHYEVPARVVADRYELGRAMGKAHRVVIAVNDEGFAGKLTALLDQYRG